MTPQRFPTRVGHCTFVSFTPVKYREYSFSPPQIQSSTNKTIGVAFQERSNDAGNQCGIQVLAAGHCLEQFTLSIPTCQPELE